MLKNESWSTMQLRAVRAAKNASGLSTNRNDIGNCHNIARVGIHKM
jgi:hypothetical protein